MFVLAERYRFPWPVIVLSPDPANAGVTIEQTFEAIFEPLPEDEARALNEEFLALETLEERVAHQHDLLLRVVKGWNDVITADGMPVPFAPETLQSALQYPWVSRGFYAAYSEAMSGDKARLGN